MFSRQVTPREVDLCFRGDSFRLDNFRRESIYVFAASYSGQLSCCGELIYVFETVKV